MSKRIRLTESDLHRIINESVNRIVENEDISPLKKISAALTSLGANVYNCQNALNINDLKTVSFFLEQINDDRDRMREYLKELAQQI